VPSVAGVNPDTPAARMTARSSVPSAPTTAACAVLPSLNCTCRLRAPLITWLFVRINPSLVRMIPDPSAAAADEDDNTDTTDGSRTAATCSTDPTAAGPPAAATALFSRARGSVPVPEVRRAPNTPAVDPAATATATVAAASNVPRPRWCAERGWRGAPVTTPDPAAPPGGKTAPPHGPPYGRGPAPAAGPPHG